MPIVLEKSMLVVDERLNIFLPNLNLLVSKTMYLFIKIIFETCPISNRYQDVVMTLRTHVGEYFL